MAKTDHRGMELGHLGAVHVGAVEVDVTTGRCAVLRSGAEGAMGGMAG